MVPVLDLKDGLVVHARRGDRASYAPIESTIAGGAQPLAIARGLMGVHEFSEAYIADLDAIAGREPHDLALAELRLAFPAVSLWVDSGFTSVEEAVAWSARGLGRPVLGTENLAEAPGMSVPDDIVLSLDFRDRFIGPAAVLDHPGDWPGEVIVMTLARVGSHGGPDFDRLAEIKARAGARRVFAAGGVRDVRDLRRLQELGLAGALVATAIHDGRLTRADLEAFARNA